jgi:hypothetical protein
MRSSAWSLTSFRLVPGSVIFWPPVFANVPPPPVHCQTISWQASFSGVPHNIPTICTCNHTPTVNQKNVELVYYPWLGWRVFQRKLLCIVLSLHPYIAVERQSTTLVHRELLMSLTRWLFHQVPLTTQSYGDLDPEEETIYHHSRLSYGCIEHELQP